MKVPTRGWLETLCVPGRQPLVYLRLKVNSLCLELYYKTDEVIANFKYLNLNTLAYISYTKGQTFAHPTVALLNDFFLLGEFPFLNKIKWYNVRWHNWLSHWNELRDTSGCLTPLNFINNWNMMSQTLWLFKNKF